ncbi:MAG TPA: glycosyltransferase [Vicinamibacterales bacterium]|nr:glycosyltransferase [Vicinamibacterales bacterium]
MRLSVVIASHDAAASIETCLAALEPQCRDSQVEVIVADSSTDATPRLIASRFAWVRLLHFDEPLALPALRGRGIAVSRGDVIAILDPYSVAAADWVACVLEAHRQRPHAVIGGTVGLYQAQSCSHATWTLYLNEYGLFMPPAEQGETWILPGNNVAYKRAALFDGATPRYPVFWKTFANWEIERGRSPLWLEPTIRVDLNKPIPLTDYLRTRYHHGRCFAGMRVQGASPVVRILRAFSTPLVPAILLWRWTRGFWPKRSDRWRFVLTLPAQLVLFTVWAWGEAWGYLRGSGRTCEQLFY